MNRIEKDMYKFLLMHYMDSQNIDMVSEDSEDQLNESGYMVLLDSCKTLYTDQYDLNDINDINQEVTRYE